MKCLFASASSSFEGTQKSDGVQFLDDQFNLGSDCVFAATKQELALYQVANYSKEFDN